MVTCVHNFQAFLAYSELQQVKTDPSVVYSTPLARTFEVKFTEVLIDVELFGFVCTYKQYSWLCNYCVR